MFLNRVAWARLVLVLAGMGLLVPGKVGLAGTAPRHDPRPNILLVVTDDQRVTGLRPVQPETRKWLKGGGVTFPNAYASTPLCCPSRASILTGRYAHNHGVLSNGASEEPGQEALDHDTTMQAYLDQAGYRTGIVGKLLNHWPLEQTPPHWDYFSTFNGGYRNRNWNVNGTISTVDTYSTTFIGYRAADFLREAEKTDRKPWMLYLAPWAPHGPAHVQTKYRDAPVKTWNGNPAVLEEDRSDKPPWLQSGTCGLACGQRIATGHARLLMSVDDLMAKMRTKLRNMEEANTLIVFMSDNGHLWGEHGINSKAQPYTKAAQVPLLMKWAGRTVPGTVDERFALNIDIAPTVLEAADIPVGETPMDGRSLLVDSPRNRVHLENWCTLQGCDRWASTRTHTYQYIERYDAEGTVIFREYYDLVADPWQLENLLEDGNDDNDPDVEALDAALSPDRSCIGGDCP